jgi:hypothetical protein
VAERSKAPDCESGVLVCEHGGRGFESHPLRQSMGLRLLYQGLWTFNQPQTYAVCTKHDALAQDFIQQLLNNF